MALIYTIRFNLDIYKKNLIGNKLGRELVALYEERGHNPLIYTDSELGSKVIYSQYQSIQQTDYMLSRTSDGDKRFQRIDQLCVDDDIVSIVSIGDKKMLESMQRELNKNFDLFVILSRDIYDNSYWLEVTHANATKRRSVDYLRNLLEAKCCA